MNKLFTLFTLLILNVLSVSAQSNDTQDVTHYFTFSDGQMVAIPEKYLLSRSEANGIVTLHLEGDTTFCYTKSGLVSEETSYNGALPVLESFKFNNKFNDQLFTDANGVIDNENNTISLTVASIQKRLVPSFKLSEENSDATAWVNGIQQHSKRTSQRFNKDVTYTLAKPKNWKYEVRKISDEVWSTPDDRDTENKWIMAPINLTEDMISTNWPSTNASEGIASLLDDNQNTYFHSNYSGTNNWKEGAYYGDGVTTWPYLEFDLDESVENLQFIYTTRNWDANNGYAPQGIIVQGSLDGENWKDIRELTAEKDNMPIGALKTFTSPVIELGAAYSHLRLQLTATTRKNYLVLSKLELNKAIINPDFGKDDEPFVPELLKPAVYEHNMVPFGRDYRVHVDFLTDNSTSEYKVPTIYINTSDGSMINSKNYYWDASFQLDGAGIWEDITVDEMQIRGRGNSSWGGGWTKEPYRMKFAEKIKPFGLTKGKNWVLLANKQSGSMTTNAIAMKIADMVESAACNHIIPVELYINGEYRGSYNFTENPGFGNNSIDIEDESKAAMVELDSYYDEPYKFRSTPFNLPVNVKEPDFSDPETLTDLTFNDIQTRFNTAMEGINYGDYETYLDVDMLARAMLVTDLTRNTETQHPKSWRVYNPDLLNDSTWIFGPVWDFDWSYGYEGHGQYFVYDAERSLVDYGWNTGNVFFKAILENSETFQKQYYRLWTQFMQKGCVEELTEFCDDYYAFAKTSFEHNATRWSDGRNYESVNTKAKEWLTKRAAWIYSNLTPYDLGDDITDPGEEDVDFGQPDRIDLASVVNKPVNVYTMGGVRVRSQVPFINATRGLTPGIYIINGKKVIVR